MNNINLSTEFPVVQQLIHLNHAAVAPWPKSTAYAVKQFAEENLLSGSSHYLQWLKLEYALRVKAQQLINAPAATDMALIKNTSEGLSFIAAGLDWNSGDTVVGIEQEFPSNRFVWQSLSHQGVSFRMLDLDRHRDNPEEALLALCDSRTRLLTISAVQYIDGFRLDLDVLGAFCRENGILFCVDAIQQLGAIPFDAQKNQADFVVADGHKWMLAPEGLGILYIRQAVLPLIKPSQYGWHMVSDASNYTARDFELAPDARRFECGSPNMLGIHALNASLGLLLDVDIETVWDMINNNISHLKDNLKTIPDIKILSDERPERRSGIVSFYSDRIAQQDLFQHLQSNQVFCAQRGGGIRFSPHFYTPQEQLDKTIELIQSLHE